MTQTDVGRFFCDANHALFQRCGRLFSSAAGEAYEAAGVHHPFRRRGGSWPYAACAQHGERVRQVGVLLGWSDSDPQFQSWFAVFVQELARLGWANGINVRIEQRWTECRHERARQLAKELVHLQPDVILVSTTPATAALQRETRRPSRSCSRRSAPNPVGSGFVAGLSQPGGNLTGFINSKGATGG